MNQIAQLDSPKIPANPDSPEERRRSVSASKIPTGILSPENKSPTSLLDESGDGEVTPKSSKDAIITLPHDSLRSISRRVGYIDDDMQTIIEQMKQATLDWEANREHEVGVALAAVQINSLWRIVVIREDYDDKSNKNFEVYINPEILKYEGEIKEEYEGCLSVKDVYGMVPRYTKVRIKAMNEQGKMIRIKAEGFLARVFQHEIDHTKGKLFVDHIEDRPDCFYKLDTNGKIIEMTDDDKEAVFSILW